MAVKNIGSFGPSGNIKPIPIWIPIPPSSDADFKFEIETDTDNIDLYNLVQKGNLTDGTTDSIGSFEIQILDPTQDIYNQFETFDKLNYYADYGEPTTLRFKGFIERKGFQDIYTTISGKAIGMIFQGKNITYNSNGAKTKDTIIKEIIDEFFSEYSINTDNVEADTSSLNVNYFEVPFLDIVSELCGATHDFYLDCNWNAHYFEKGSRTNETDGISEQQNHIETTDNSYDTESTFTKVRSYGSQIDNIPLIYTSESDTSNTKGVVKEQKIDNSSLITDLQLKDFTDLEFSSKNQIPKVGSHSSLLLPTIQPGEKLFIVIPREGIEPGFYSINSYTHEFDIGGDTYAKTIVNIVKRREQISDIIKKRVQFENKIADNPNPNKFNFSKVVQFLEDSGTHNGTFILEKRLQVLSGLSNGIWESDTYDLGGNVSAIEVRMGGESLIKEYNSTSSKLYFSLDGGTSWTLNPPSGVISSIPTGRRLKFKVVLNSPDAKVQVVGALYSK